jgi:hypothetical protein
MGSEFDDLVYWRFFRITVNYNNSHIELLLQSLTNESLEQSRAEQQLTAGNQPARSLLASNPAGTHGHIVVSVKTFVFSSFFVPPLIKGRGWAFFFIIGVPLLHLIPPEVTLK